jgi:hypothetical protein
MRRVILATLAALLLTTFDSFAIAQSAPVPDRTYAGHNVTFSGTKPALEAFLVETPAADGAVHLDVWEVNRGTPIRSYDVDMTKLLHMIVVSDDLADFQHIHPVLHASGHFTIDLHATERELYHVYIDGIPHGVGRQVFRFDIPIGSSAPAAQRHLNAAGASQQAGPYSVTLAPLSVPFGEIATIAVTITKNHSPANDLHPYLGAMAHGVFIGTKDLAYMHGHGMSDQMLDMASGDCGDSMMLSMPPLPANSTIGNTFSFEILAPSGQNYDFWMQFIGGKTLYTVPFLITTR